MALRQPVQNATDVMNSEERDFLRQAEKKYRANVSWFEFEDFAFGMRSPLFARTRSHLDVLKHPLYVALKEMWLDLGEKQGLVASKQKEKHAERRKSQGRGSANRGRDSAKKRDVEATDSSTGRRVPKSRA